MLSTAAHINYGAKSQIPKAIVENPFRILGVFANASQKEIVANQGKANAFLKVGRAVEYPLDLGSILPKVDRNIEIFNKANSNLTIAKERLKYAQFWFLKMTPLDDVAFNHLYAGNLQQAVEIWNKKNCVSSLQNKVITHFIANNFDQAINTAEDLYNQFSDDFLKAADPTGTLDLYEDDLIHSFIDNLCTEYEPKKIYDIVFSSNWKEYLGGKTVKPLIDRINAAIKKAKDADDSNPKNELDAGIALSNNTQGDFKQLKSILPSDDPQLESIADKLGMQILQCAINYYNNSDDEDAAENAMALQKSASKIVMGEMAKDRCEDNLKVLEKIIAELPPKEVRREYRAVMEEVGKIVKKSQTIINAKSLLNATESNIKTIKQKLGSKHNEYIRVSTLVIQIAMSFVVEEINKVQAAALLTDRIGNVSRYQVRDIIKSKLADAWSAILLMDDFDIDYEFKSHYNENRSALKSMCQDFGISTSIPRPKSITTSPNPPITYQPPKREEYSPQTNNEDTNVGKIFIWLIIIVVIICIISNC